MARLPDTQQKTAYEDNDWMLAAEEVDQETVEEEGAQYPFIQWVNGAPTEKRGGGVPYTGGWFMQGEQVDDDEIPGWEAGELIHSNGSSTPGFFRRDLRVAILHWRRCWRVRLTEDKIQNYPWSQYDEASKIARPTGRVQVLVMIQGLEQMGPVVLTMKGSTSQSFSKHALANFRKNLMDVANSMIRKSGRDNKLPFRAFWLELGPERKDDGTPEFTKVGEGANSSLVTLIAALGLDERLTQAELSQHFVGRETLAEFSRLWVETESWAHAWEQFEAQPDDSTLGTPKGEAAPAGDPANNPYAQSNGKPEAEELPF